MIIYGSLIVMDWENWLTEEYRDYRGTQQCLGQGAKIHKGILTIIRPTK